MNNGYGAQGELTQRLGALYNQYGYRAFKMSKFEEYDFYAEYKSFLKSGAILTFTDANGRLLALKPDITLSIVKNARAYALPEKVYYNENVYRADAASGEFRELKQLGLEFLGEVDLYTMGEVLTLAAESLRAISETFVLDISHMGFVAPLLKEACLTASVQTEVLEAIGRKSPHDVRAALTEAGVEETSIEKLTALAGLSGGLLETLEAAEALTDNPESRQALQELRAVSDLIAIHVPRERLRLDFSIVNDMRYYNGITFQGYVSGVPTSVLSGGRYDNLLARMGKAGGAIGFALYLDLLERLGTQKDEYDADALILYGADADPMQVMQAVRMLTSSGQRVLARRGSAEGLSARQVLRVNDRGLEIVE